MKNLLIFLFFLLLIYVVVSIYLYLTQEEKIFQIKYANYYKPTKAKEITFITKDNIKLTGAFLENKKSAPLVLYFSGNANNVVEFIDKISPLIKDFNFIGFNYPGYAESEGTPCERCILKYSLEIFDKYKPDFLIGRSLGSSVASFVASKRKVKGVLLITPFSSIECIAKKRYPFLPISLLLKHKCKEVEFIKNIDSLVSIIALKNDDVIPKKCLDELIKNIKNLKDIIFLDGITHGKIYEYPNIEKIIEKMLKDFK